jgi:sensor histidine kinase regulating citrate/malate metabolism
VTSFWNEIALVENGDEMLAKSTGSLKYNVRVSVAMFKSNESSWGAVVSPYQFVA